MNDANEMCVNPSWVNEPHANETYKKMLCAIRGIGMSHAKEQRTPEYEKGWDDAMCRINDLVNTIFPVLHDPSPQEQRLDAVATQKMGQPGKTNDPVNHPSHYTAHSIEVIDFLEDWMLPFHLANALKYICRAGKKDPNKTVEDLQKAVWYVNRYIRLLEERGGAV